MAKEERLTVGPRPCSLLNGSVPSNVTHEVADLWNA
jgi:hypothetical protein